MVELSYFDTRAPGLQSLPYTIFLLKGPLRGGVGAGAKATCLPPPGPCRAVPLL